MRYLVCYQLRKEFQLGLQISTLIIEIYTVHGSFAFNINIHLPKWQGACSLADWMDALEHRCLAMMGLEEIPDITLFMTFPLQDLSWVCYTEALSSCLMS